MGHLVLGLQRPPDGGPAAPRAEGDHPIFATDRRYTDDVHYGGGARRGMDILDYPTYMVAFNALPPVPFAYGAGWREEWRRRIEANEPWLLHWLEHQNEDAYWRRGSSIDAYDRIEAATLVIAGHADGYRNMAFRAFERLRGPKQICSDRGRTGAHGYRCRGRASTTCR